MKITCQACHAKYTIADEKVLGKVVKIRCKKCGATIVVNGNDPAAHAGSSRPPPPAPSFEHAAHGGQRDAWTVNVGDGDQRTMTAPEVVAAYRAGHVDGETFCWKDGMSDWLALREIESLHAACTAPRARAAPSEPAANEDDLPTRIQDASMMLGTGLAAPHAAMRRPETKTNGHRENAPPPASVAAAARRTGGRAPAADLFGGAAHAGGEEDVLTSAPAGMPNLHDESQKATGARNENSVLFSLTALSNKGGAPIDEMPNTIGEASGLIDIRQLSAQLHSDDSAKRSRVEDIMNLGGGGAFNPALSAPILSAPPLGHYPSAAPTGSGRFQNIAKGKPLVVLALGLGVFVVVAAIGATTVLTRGKDAPAVDNEALSASAGTVAPEPARPKTPAAVATNAPPPEPSAAPHENAAPSAEPPPPQPVSPIVLPKGVAAEVPRDPARATPKAAPGQAKEVAAPAVAVAADQPFNMGEAKARLAAIAGSAQSCKRGDVTGTGRVVVTFAPSGQAQSANLAGPPFEGTAVGSCVATRFRAARVPAFSGSPFTVSKSFTIN